MKTVSIREFQLNAGKYLEFLPIVLTRYNIPFAIVQPYGTDDEKMVLVEYGEEKPVKVPVMTPASTMPVQNTPKDLPTEQIWENRDWEPVMAKVKQGYCDKHYWDKITQKLFLVKFENANGDLTLENKWYCQKCVDEVKKGIEENGGKFLPTV